LNPWHSRRQETGRKTTMEKERERERKEEFDASEIEYVSYGGEHHLPLIMNLVDQELSEPYSIFTYRYFVYLWPQLSFLVSVILFLLFFFYVLGNFFCCNFVCVGGFSISGVSQREMCRDCCV
jgi:hypothetical protein